MRVEMPNKVLDLAMGFNLHTGIDVFVYLVLNIVKVNFLGQSIVEEMNSSFIKFY